MKPSELLRAAWAVIEDPGHWTQWTLARVLSGSLVGPRDARAVSFCAEGALYRVCGVDEGEEAASLLTKIAYDMGFRSVNDLNDSTDHTTVAQMYSRAIEVAEAAEAAS